jgi:hypothetical protein
VLRVAGGLKRGEPDKGEDELLMRALRDFNTPKIPAQDILIFKRLIADLFIGLGTNMPFVIVHHIIRPTLGCRRSSKSE